MLNESCEIYERYACTPGEVAQELYFCPQWMGRFLCKEDFFIERSDYKSILLRFTVKGKGELNYKGQKYALEKGSLALINCTEHHSYHPIGNGWEFMFLHFTGNNSQKMCEHIQSFGDAVFYEKHILQEKLSDIIKSCKEKTAAYEATVSREINDILYSIIIEIHKKEKDKMQSVCDYITEHYAESLSTKRLSEIALMSRCAFSVQFKRTFGTSPHDYLLCTRINEAKRLLVSTDLSVEEIGENTGFGDMGTFIRAFKRKEGVTPLQYRKNGFN